MSEPQRRLACIMFSDMVGYSALAQRNERHAIELLNEHRHLLRALFPKHGGREMDAVGDGFFVEFSSAVDASRCAIAIQQALHARNATLGEGDKIELRIGLHLGDVVVENNRIVGDGVNIAARLQPLAQPGEIVVSEDVARQVQNKIDSPLDSLGVHSLKNISAPMPLYRVRLPWQSDPISLPSIPPKRTGFANRRVVYIAGFVLILAALGGYVWKGSQTSSVMGSNRVVVLPFVSLSSDKADEYFADGITEELIATLSRVRGLEMIARTTAMTYKGSSKKIAEIGRELNASTVIEGSVRKAGGTVRISAQLVRADNEAPMWSESYDQDLRNVLTIQQDIARRVVAQLSSKLTTLAASAPDVETHGPNSHDAYDAYLRGRYHAGKANIDSMKEAVHYFEEAIRLDPDFALAYSALAEAAVQLPIQNEDDPAARGAYAKAKAAATNTIQLAPALAEPYAVLGIVKAFSDYDWNSAETQFQHALSLNPNSAVVHWWYAWLHMTLRRHDDSVAHLKRAIELDPLSIAKHFDLVWAYITAAKWDEAVRHASKTITMDPDNFVGLLALGWAYHGKGMNVEAEEAFTKIGRINNGEPWARVDLMNHLAIIGETKRALSIHQEIVNQLGFKRLSGFTQSLVFWGLATRDPHYREPMYRELNRARQEHSPWIQQTSNPFWKPFYDEPRWAEFRASMNLPP